MVGVAAKKAAKALVAKAGKGAPKKFDTAGKGGDGKAEAPLAKGKGKGGEAVAPLEGARPHFGVESTRSQIMCRTGLKGPGQTHAIKFGGTSGRPKAKALAEAAAWVKAERKRFGIS